MIVGSNVTSDAASNVASNAASSMAQTSQMSPAVQGCLASLGGGLGSDPVVFGDGPRRLARNGPLLGLAGSSVEGRFRAWTGGSGRRYVFSVFPLGLAVGGIEHLPVEGASVVIGVERRGDGACLPVFVAESGAVPEAFFRCGLVDDLRARGSCELHVHLTAADGAQRRGIVADLAA